MPGAVKCSRRTAGLRRVDEDRQLFALRDPTATARMRRSGATVRLYQDALSCSRRTTVSMLTPRNLTKIARRAASRAFDRVAALPHGIADTYDMAYGLARDKDGRFVFGYAPYANATMPGSGGALRLRPGKPPEEVAFGMRNPLGWCSDTDGEVFFTDNQGDWVAANKLCHVTEGKYFGWPNRAQPQHATKPAGKASVWVPYGWARSINGVTYDNTDGKFGPFAGQFFIAELMHGGAIIRADVEKVNGEYQGVCFPFWGRGLIGPLCLTSDPRGRLFVGGITQPGWMGQPDRGGLFRIDYTGEMPFEMQSIHVRPQGFRVVFTKPVDKLRAADLKSYRLEKAIATSTPSAHSRTRSEHGEDREGPPRGRRQERRTDGCSTGQGSRLLVDRGTRPFGSGRAFGTPDRGLHVERDSGQVKRTGHDRTPKTAFSRGFSHIAKFFSFFSQPRLWPGKPVVFVHRPNKSGHDEPQVQIG